MMVMKTMKIVISEVASMAASQAWEPSALESVLNPQQNHVP